METYVSPSVSSHPCSQDYNYNNMMSCLQKLDLSSGNQESSRNNNDHGVLDASHYSCVSLKPQCVDQGNTFSDQERVGINIGPGYYSWMYREANRVRGISMPGGTFPAYDPRYMGGSAMSQNGCFGLGFTQLRSNDQNVYHNQGFTETRSNGQNGYDNQEFTESSNGVSVQSPESKTNQQDFVSMAMRNEQLMRLQYEAVVELAQCRRILNQTLRHSLPQLETKMAVPTRIFVGGLASTVTESDFKTYFDQFGIITNVEVKYDHITQRTRGFGFITFDSEKAVDKVLLRTPFHELNGKMVEVKRAFPKDLYRKSIRGQLSGLNYGLRKVSNVLGAYAQANRQLFPRIMI